MTGLRNILKKKKRIDEDNPDIPEITFLRTTTSLQEVIEPPDFPEQRSRPVRNFSKPHLGYRDSANASITKDPTARRSSDDSRHNLDQSPGEQPAKENRRSIFHRSRSKSDVSVNIPQHLGEEPPLPTISVNGTVNQEERAHREERWEKRATILATNNALLDTDGQRRASHSRERSPSISDAQGDTNIQEAIRLHEAGDLVTSTRMFGRLADPNGTNNALSQVLYGLALRHGWGIDVNPQRAIHYLSLAAANSANIEGQALASGIKKGGAAKGELVLAIFELANCFRNGWGVDKDAAAARHYYETAANLGDTDAMEEAAWCYVEGFGGPKDKFKAAQYLRLAEKTGNKLVGNSWVWKDKYNPK